MKPESGTQAANLRKALLKTIEKRSLPFKLSDENPVSLTESACVLMNTNKPRFGS
jgi:hypothetical protein